MIHRVKRLLEIHKNPVEGQMLKIRKLLTQLDFHGGCPCASLIEVAMEAVMEFNDVKSTIHNSFKDLPERYR